MDNNNDLLFWKLGQMNAAKGYAAASKGRPSGMSFINTEVETYVTGLSTALSSTQITLLETFVSALKTGLSITNLSDAFDVMYILAGETQESSYRNIVKNAHHIIAVNSPAWTKFEGTKFDGLSQYLRTQYNPTANADKYAQNSASAGYYLRENTVAGMGYAPSSGAVLLQYSNSGNNSGVRVNEGTGAAGYTLSNRTGLWINSRDAANSTKSYHNGNDVNTRSTAPIGIPNGEIQIGGYILLGTQQYYTNQFAFVFIGSAKSQANVTVIRNAIEAYMDANSKGVI